MERKDDRLEIPPKKNVNDPYEVTVMPSPELLQDFLRGMRGDVRVVFDTTKGLFERVAPKIRVEYKDNSALKGGESYPRMD